MMQSPRLARSVQTESAFLERLSNSSADLSVFVSEIKDAQRAVRLYKELEQDPFQRDAQGKLRFAVQPWGEDINLLEVATSLDEALSAVRGGYNLLEVQSGTHLTKEYQGPRITFFPDTNIELSPWYQHFLSTLYGSPVFNKEIITLVREEMQRGGIHRRHGAQFQPELLRAEQSLIKRCPGITSTDKTEIATLYDAIKQFFTEEAQEVYKLSKRFGQETPDEVAARFVDAALPDGCNPTAYKNMIKKMVENHRAGKENNPVTDRVLAATAFGFNLVRSDGARAVVVSNDADLQSVFSIFYHEILPRFMAKTAIEAIRQRNSAFLKIPGYESRTIEAAKAHIEWAAHDGPTFSVGILYSPATNQFHTYQIAQAFRPYFANVAAYRIGKSEIIEKMATDRISASKALEQLMQTQKHSS